MLTGTLPFGKLTGPEVIIKVHGGGSPPRPAGAPELGLTDKVWELLEGCWKSDRMARPSVKDVLSRVKAAASICGTLSPVGGALPQLDDPESEINKFGRSFPHLSSDVEFLGLCR